ncbi:hypothetical protein AURDEDRAFT_111983 [Auricularia subglabra TFB-10046 SS5]|nr:hypothetical protein AURDEDRAFT_111983 [Auricularia subglabra TFB-10046 SS5]
MATYFTPVVKRERSAAGSSVVKERPSLDTVSTSILIFPSPPTAVGSSAPPSPCTSSISSVPTDLTFPSDSGALLSRRTSARRGRSLSRTSSLRSTGRSSSFTPSVLASGWEDLEEEDANEADDLALWQQNGRSASGATVFPESARDRERWFELVVQPKLEARARTLSTRSSASQLHLAHNAPHPPIHLPLLDLFRSVFSFDEDTVKLLTRGSSSRSELFPSSPFDAASIAEEEEAARADAEREHAGALVLRHETTMLQQGMEAAADLVPGNPFAVPFSFWTLISIVTGVVGSSGRLLSSPWRRAHAHSSG